jgi:hypothetical protein
VGHLQDKLDDVRDEIGGKRIELSDESVVDVLRECEMAFNNVMRRIRAGADAKRREMMMGGDSLGSSVSAPALLSRVSKFLFVFFIHL